MEVEQLPSMEDFLTDHMLAGTHGMPGIITGALLLPPLAHPHLSDLDPLLQRAVATAFCALQLQLDILESALGLVQAPWSTGRRCSAGRARHTCCVQRGRAQCQLRLAATTWMLASSSS